MSRTPLPWRYPHQEDGPRLDTIVQRPIVPVTVIGADSLAASAFALVDSGCEHILMSQGFGRTVGLDYKGSQREIDLGIGGRTQKIRFVDAVLRLHPDAGDDDDYLEWQTEVGFVPQWKPTFQVLLGQVGFLDHFTVTLSRHAQEISVEGLEVYDSRFPPRHLKS